VHLQNSHISLFYVIIRKIISQGRLIEVDDYMIKCTYHSILLNKLQMSTIGFKKRFEQAYTLV